MNRRDFLQKIALLFGLIIATKDSSARDIHENHDGLRKLIFKTSSSYSLKKCTPTPPDMEGPFYKPNAPVRNSTGKGLTVKGRVLSYPDCKPVANATIEYWHANPEGVYDDAHRATLFADKEGRYEFTTDFPGMYPGRPAHIHFKIKAEDFKPLTTQLYFRKVVKEETFDIVIVPLK